MAVDKKFQQNGILLDTHVLIWLRSGRLSGSAETLLALRNAAEESTLYLLDFSLFEISQAVWRGRLTLDRPLLEWFQLALPSFGPEVLAITPLIAAATLQLPESFHGDPGDRLLAAAAITQNLTICTHDDALLRFGKQGLFRTLKVSESRA